MALANELTDVEKDELISALLRVFTPLPFCVEDMLSDRANALLRRFHGEIEDLDDEDFEDETDYDTEDE